jgi:hypothetical protein
MLKLCLLRLALLFCLPLIAKIDLADWPIEKTAPVEEALFVRRIADFWQEGEYGIAKSQMEKFLEEFPESQFCDPLRVCLGDILLREKNFSGALSYYSGLSSPEFAAKASRNQMQCLYNLQWYSTLADKCEERLGKEIDPEAKLETTFYLAISLYHQCLNAAKDSEALLKLAKRAEPHFETLLKSPLSVEVSQAFAHLCCILGEKKKAADLYLQLAKEDDLKEEMTFQAALIQAEFDKSLSLASFAAIAKGGGKRAEEAAYNHLILSFGAGMYEEIVREKDAILSSIPEERRGMSHLYLGKSLLCLKQYGEAVGELTTFLTEEKNPELESTRSCLTSLIEAAHQLNDVTTLDSALVKLSEIDPAHMDIAKGKFLKALLLKTLLRNDEARAEFQNLALEYPEFAERGAALFEWADLEYQAGAWEACRERSKEFLEQFPNHENVIHAWRYLGASSSHLLNVNPERREQFVEDLETLLAVKGLFALHEVKDWSFYLARGYFELGRFEEAIQLLKALFADATPFAQGANAHLLLGFCYRDAFGDLAGYCSEAEIAIADSADLTERDLLHLSLFNAYLKLSQKVPDLVAMSAHHLYEAYSCKADISKENLFWLGSWYLSKGNGPKALLLFSKILEDEFDETACYKIAKLHAAAGRVDEQVSNLEKLVMSYEADPSRDWLWESEAKLLLAEGYEQKGLEERALELFEEIGDGVGPLYSETVAKAYFEKAKIRLARFERGAEELEEVASQFKDLSLQRRLDSEPVHLEAALEYISLMAKGDLEKRISLLEKMKRDFESEGDILSKDYHQARLKYPDKNKIYESYMKLIDAEILIAKSGALTDTAAQKELQAKSKDLLLQIKRASEPPALLKRVHLRLQDSDVSVIE